MTREAVDQRAHLYLVASAHVSPEDDHDDMEEAMKVYTKEEDAQIKEDLDLGLASFERNKPAAQLRAFLISTLQEDMPFILTEGWHEAHEAGLAQPLTSERLYMQATVGLEMATQVATLTGGPLPPPRETSPYDFWPLVLRCRESVFKRLQSQFRSLLTAEARKQGKATEPIDFMAVLAQIRQAGMAA